MLSDGERLSRLWRYVFAQMLDDYTSVLHDAGLPTAARMWSAAPCPAPEARRFYSSDSLIVDVA
jgi:hypothetical protein